MNTNQLHLSLIENYLEGRLSKNPKRFEEANGIVFAVDTKYDATTLHDYFLQRGIEFHSLDDGFYYTETIMSLVEFEYLEPVLFCKVIA